MSMPLDLTIVGSGKATIIFSTVVQEYLAQRTPGLRKGRNAFENFADELIELLAAQSAPGYLVRIRNILVRSCRARRASFASCALNFMLRGRAWTGARGIRARHGADRVRAPAWRL